MAFFGFSYWQHQQKKQSGNTEKQILVYPHQQVTNITMVAAVSGIIGAKIFALVEDLDLVMNGTLSVQDLIDGFFSGGGMAIYGGLIIGVLVSYFYLKRINIPPIHALDAVAPALMISYGTGRLACHFSGDGCWGIPIEKISTTGKVLWRYTKPDWLSFLPDWMWAYDYPHNFVQEGERIVGCSWQYCNELNVGVFPTPIYEFLMAMVLGLALWMLRKRIKIPGLLFSLFVFLNGFERFWIEKIRVNEHYDVLGIPTTQAEFIAVVLMSIGLIGGAFLWAKSKK